MNVYVVMGDTGVTHEPEVEVLGVFSTEEKATAAIAAYRNDPEISTKFGDDFWIDDYTVDEGIETEEAVNAQPAAPVAA